MKLVFADEAWEDYMYWQKHDKHMAKQINKLICDPQRTSFGAPRA